LLRANISFAFRGVKTTLPPNLRGWDTGTLEIGDARIDIDPKNTSLFEPRPLRLRVISSESTEVMPKKEADVNGNTISWQMDMLRLPVYARYQSSIVFEVGKVGGPLALAGVSNKPEAIAVLWMQDLTDDIEQEVKLPVLVGKDLATLRLNAINDQTAKYHDFTVVGTLTAKIKLDSGLDEDHEVGPARHGFHIHANHSLEVEPVSGKVTDLMQKLRLSQSRRHAFEA
jgi:hypothetical protein